MMPSISYDAFVPWTNYHLTVGTITPPDLAPHMQIEDLGRFHAGDLSGSVGIERFAATAAQLQKHVGRVWSLMERKKALGELGDPPEPFPAALVGRGWSFSNIIGAGSGEKLESVLMCEGLAGSILLERGDLEPNQRAGLIALTAGGTRFRELLDWAAAFGRSIETSGTHLGATVAGAIATATHGSRLGYGGTQNMIVGLHIITGVNESVWIERAKEPVLTDAAAQKLNPPGGAKIRIIRDDDKFEDALVHLGCMGILNCVAIRMVEDEKYEVLRYDKPVHDEWLEWVAAGEWGTIANWLDETETRKPIFYEATLNPHGWPSALHTMFFKAGDAPLRPATKPTLSKGDAIASFSHVFSVRASADFNDAKIVDLPKLKHNSATESAPEQHFAPEGRALPVDIHLIDPTSQAHSVYDYYQHIAFSLAPGEHRLSSNVKISEPKTWREIHGDEITGGSPGVLFNASYAIERNKVVKAIPAIIAAVHTLPKSFVLTLRFVSNAAGSLAFTRFPETCVIDIDGLSPWICQKIRSNLAEDPATYEKDKRMLDYLEHALPAGATRLARALDKADIAFSNHFGKLGDLNPGKITKDFGAAITRWRATRDDLLSSPLAKAIFWNWGAVKFGLVERPNADALELAFQEIASRP